MKKIYMAQPDSFNVNYEINPWMKDNINKVNTQKAKDQWHALHHILLDSGAKVEVLPAPPENCPDAVFTANAGLLYKNTFIPSAFKNQERMIEEPYFITWFLQKHTIADYEFNNRYICSFEGAGDALFDLKNNLWFGFGFRSSYSFKTILDNIFDKTDIIVRPLELVDPRFYHLDTCFCPLDTGHLLWYPAAFSQHSQMIIRSWFKDKSIEVDENNALKFACNAVSINNQVILPIIDSDLDNVLKLAGLTPIMIDMSEFLLSGGACKCLTLSTHL